MTINLIVFQECSTFKQYEEFGFENRKLMKKLLVLKFANFHANLSKF